MGKLEVTLQHDPETGDLVMPIPLSIIESEDWRTGDVVHWTVLREMAMLKNLSKATRDLAVSEARVALGGSLKEICNVKTKQ